MLGWTFTSTTGIVIQLGALTSLDGVWVDVDRVGAMDLSTLTNLTDGRMEYDGFDIPLPNLMDLRSTDVVINRLDVTYGSVANIDDANITVNGGSVLLPQITSKRGGGLAANGQSLVSLPALTVLEKTNLTASSGGQINLPNVTNYDSVDGAFTWETCTEPSITGSSCKLNTTASFLSPTGMR